MARNNDGSWNQPLELPTNHYADYSSPDRNPKRKRGPHIELASLTLRVTIAHTPPDYKAMHNPGYPLPTIYYPLPTTMPNIIGIGTDITECLRWPRLIERHGELFLNRVYTTEEIRYCQSRKQATQHFAARWVAKEAILKALGTGWRRGISWRNIEIRNQRGGKPVVAVRGGVKELVETCGAAEILISMSHCRTHAVAYAVAVGKEDA